jgi:hypothetical protein
MADIDDVLTTLGGLIATALYPNGTTHASAVTAQVKIYPGWPVPNVLDADLAAGNAHVSIFPRPEERNTTRHAPEYQQAVITPATLTVLALGNTVTIGGIVSVPQAVMVVTNFGKQSYSYFVLQADTLDSIATALAALIPDATAIGAVITIPGVYDIRAQIITSGTAIKEVRRQERLVQMVIWAPTPALRTAIARVVDPILAQTERFILPDGSNARLTYKSSPINDMLQKATIYRRDLFYTVEYATTVQGTFYTVGNTEITLNPAH